MIGGAPNRFLESVASGNNTVYIFRGITYWAQGWTIFKGFHYEIYQHEPYDPIISNQNMWEYDGLDSYDCMHAFEKAPIFDGKTFWEVESEIEWIDW